jgi:hypothetical protein
MGALGNLQHHDAITGTAAQKVVDNFSEKAKTGKERIDKQNKELLIEKLNQTHGIKVKDMDVELGF